MDVMGVGSLLLSAIGVGLSVLALVQAGGAQKLSKTIQKSDDQVSRDDARELLDKLNDARDASMARRGNATRAATAGRSAAKDILAVKLAQDALATTALSNDSQLESSLRAASNLSP